MHHAFDYGWIGCAYQKVSYLWDKIPKPNRTFFLKKHNFLTHSFLNKLPEGIKLFEQPKNIS